MASTAHNLRQAPNKWPENKGLCKLNYYPNRKKVIRVVEWIYEAAINMGNSTIKEQDQKVSQER